MKKQLKQNGFADHEPQRLKLRDFSHEDPAWELADYIDDDGQEPKARRHISDELTRDKKIIPAKIQVAIKNKDKSEEAFLHFQRITTYLHKKFDIMIGEQREEIDLGKGFQAEFYLYLYDKNGNPINQADLVNEGVTAKLQVFVTKNSDKFPDKVSELTCRLKEIKNCEQTSDGKLIITADDQEKEKILDRINNVNGKLVANNFENEIGGDGRLLEKGSDIRFKIEKDQADGRGVRVDIYKCPDETKFEKGNAKICSSTNYQRTEKVERMTNRFNDWRSNCSFRNYFPYFPPTNQRLMKKKKNLILINEEESQQLNKQYRQKDYQADVLAFPFARLYQEKLADCEDLGDIFLCYPLIQKQT
ncbi:13369_t:CDS:2 [Entrophospora sp. SA101]|nr:13369_t:CDS:2 [Entrophospora sp. SA101]